MSANSWVKFITFGTLGTIIYITLSQTPDQEAFQQLLLTQPSVNKFTENFEDFEDPSELFAADFSGWHQIGLQKNELKFFRNPTNNCLIVSEDCLTSAFANNIALERRIKYRGKQALKLTAGPSQNGFGRKSVMSIRRHLFDFGNEDDLYFSGWFYLDGDEKTFEPDTRNLAFMGMRSANRSWRYRKEPGRFLFFDRNNYIASDLFFWLPKPEPYKQEILQEVSLPFKRWTNVRAHIKFSPGLDGLIEIWQDGEKVLYRKGQTIPESKTVYSILELGILQHQDPQNQQTIYLDDIQVDDKPFFKL